MENVKAWCRKRDMWAASKGPRTSSKGEMRKYSVGLPFERIAIDVAGPIPETGKGNKLLPWTTLATGRKISTSSTRK